jgi:peptidoglycan/LPS O-acetylase OafA/YrhL
MGVARRAWVVVRAQVAAWRGHARRSRHTLTSAALVVAGLAGALGGGWLVGRWCAGLVLIAESAGCVWAGLMRDDGAGLPRRGERTIAEVLEDARRLP